MDPLNVFVPLAKVDVAKRLVYGTMALEAPDRSGEIMDYETARPAIEKWSNGFATSTNGESLGNVREMHSKIAAGKLTSIEFDDVLKKVNVCAYIEDDSTWGKVEKHVLTGFSIGGGYSKRWPDPKNRMLKRYTPLVLEVSLVDSPCMPGATIEMVKADGTSETVEIPERFEPANEDVKTLAGELAKVAGKPDRQNDFVVQARAELIKRHAGTVTIEVEIGGAPVTAEEVAGLMKLAHPDVSEAVLLAAATGIAAEGLTPERCEVLVKAWTAPVETPKDPEVDPVAELEKLIAETAPVAPPVTDGPFSDLKKASEALKAIITAGQAAPLAKGLYTVQWLAELMSCFSDLQSCMACEAEWEGDNSPLPAKAAAIVAAIGALLVSSAQEEAAEAVAMMDEAGIELVMVSEPVVLELATKIVDLVKCDTALMEKVGARNSKTDGARIQAIHDHAAGLGAACADDEVVEKLAKADGLVDELARARRVVASAIPQIQELTKRGKETDEALAKMVASQATLEAELEKLRKGPGLAKGVLYPIGKDRDDRGFSPTTTDSDPTDPNGPAPEGYRERRDWALRKLGGESRQIPAPGGEIY